MPITQGSSRARAYLVLQKDRYGHPDIVALRKEKPILASGQIAIRVVVNVPLGLFETFIPAVEVELHENEVIPPTVELEEQTDTEDVE